MKQQNKTISHLVCLTVLLTGLFLPSRFIQAENVCICESNNKDCLSVALPSGQNAFTVLAKCEELCKTKLGATYQSTQFGFATEGDAKKFKCEQAHQEFLKMDEAKTSTKPAETKQPLKPITPKLNVEIPGLKFSDAIVTDTTVKSTFLADYINAMYKYLLGIGITIGIVMAMVGGMQYVLAAGSGNVKKGKERIINAVTGIILLAAVFLILQTVNPQLVSLKMVELQTIPFASLPASHSGDLQGVKGPKCSGTKVDPPEFAGLGKSELGPLEPFACGNRPLSQIKYLVIHEGGPDGTTVGILQKRGYSTHFVIERDGTIKQTIDLRTIAVHASSLNSFSVGVDLAIAKNCSPSGQCVKDLECSSKCSYEAAQYTALNSLIGMLTSKTGIQKIDEKIIGHCQGFDSSHGDPRNLDWSKLGLNSSKHREGSIVNGKCIISWTEDVLKQLKKELYSKKSTNSAQTIPDDDD